MPFARRVTLAILAAMLLQAGCSEPTEPTAAPPGDASAPRPRTETQVAQEAFYALEAHPFDGEVFQKAQSDLLDAYRGSSKDPWVLIGLSRALLNVGYIQGDRSELTSYRADHVERAKQFAEEAVKHGNSLGMAHAYLARIRIITGNYRGAWEELNKAHELDPEGFYSWYYRAVVSLKMKDHARGASALKEAEQRAVRPYQKEWVFGRLIDVAEITGNVAEQEAYYKKLIDFAPDEATNYGNYALFLKRHKRYDEAITYYDKAIAIRPYGNAVEQLKQTRILREAAKQQLEIFEAESTPPSGT